MRKPILCLDFDGVLHSYKSGWKGADVIIDPPVPGALEALKRYVESGLEVHIYSSRSNEENGILAMQLWLSAALIDADLEGPWADQIKWPRSKPPAKVSIDDRAIPFDGTWPDPEAIHNFKPWNMR